METLTKSVLIPMALMLVSGFIVAWVNAKVKFTTNEAEATRAIRRAIFSVFSWVWQLLCMGYVGYRWYTDSPITRFEIFIIALLVAWFVLVAMMFVLAKYAELSEKHLLETYKLYERIEALEKERSLKG